MVWLIGLCLFTDLFLVSSLIYSLFFSLIYSLSCALAAVGCGVVFFVGGGGGGIITCKIILDVVINVCKVH